MKKNKIIICLFMTLITLCASSLTVYATETTESEVEETITEETDTNEDYSYSEYEYNEKGEIIVKFKSVQTGFTHGYYDEVRRSATFTYDATLKPFVYVNEAASTAFIVHFMYENSDNLSYDFKVHEQQVEVYLNGDYIRTDIQKTNGFTWTENTVTSCNIPIFMSLESARVWANSGDDSEIINKPPIPEKDEKFEFVNFDSNEYVSFSWSGTTLDDKADEFDKMGFEVEVGYSYTDSKEIAESIFVVTNGDLSTKGWSRRQLALKPEDWGYEDMYLRSVSIRPYYTKYGEMCLGKTETIYLNVEGNLDFAVNEELTFIVDEDFYILGASVVNSNLGLVDGDVRSHISWTGTTRDDRICKIPLDKAYAETLCLCYSSGMKPVFVEYCELDPDFFGGDTLPLRRSSSDSTQGFYLNYTEVYEAARARGLEFAGKMYITPYYFYEYENAIYKGAVTVIDVLNNELEINPDSGNITAPDLTKPTPSPTPTAGTENEGIEGDAGTLDDDLTFDNAFPMFWKMLKSLWASMGQFPSLMYSLYPYLPEELYKIIGIVLIGIVIFRFLGR